MRVREIIRILLDLSACESVSSDKPSYQELSEELSSVWTTVAEQSALIEKLTAETPSCEFDFSL